jgi:site-specific DNA-methyltransferase (adenine-specific)
MIARCLHGNCLSVLDELEENSVDSIVTDPPYEIGFMGQSWDKTGIAYNSDVWKKCLRVLKPGGHLIAFGGSRTYHRLAVAIEDAGFEIRDQIQWIYGTGFPKSLNISKAMDAKNMLGKSNSRSLRHVEQTGDGDAYTLTGRNNGIMGEHRVYERKTFTPSTDSAKQWNGWGTALKPAHEPIVLARKPLNGTVAENVQTWGVAGLNIDATRIGNENNVSEVNGRWPSNVILDEYSAFLLDEQSSVRKNAMGASQFFYVAKPSRAERDMGLEDFQPVRDADRIKDDGVGGDNPRNRTNNPRLNYHPTVKPIELMKYLVQLVTPEDGIVLDPFMGSGSTACAAVVLGNFFIGIDIDSEYLKIAEARIEYYIGRANKRLSSKEMEEQRRMEL